jgi:riboflavin kinase / FMN adenylyltransferase
MRIYRALTDVPDPVEAGRVVAIGVFDGVHRGHQEILSQAVAAARTAGATPTAVTFYPHPDAVLHRRSAPPMLTPLERKAELLEGLGVDELVVVPFDREFARLTPEAFCSAVLSDHLGARAVFVGENFHFGHGGAGTPADLRLYGQTHGFAVVAVGLAREAGEVISSTRIREAIRQGDIGEATRLLGRPHRIEGTVISGVGRGRGLEAPTANLAPTPDMALPRLGIYVTQSTVNGKDTYRSVTSVGTNPTFESDGKIRIETLLFEFTGNLYGANLAVDFLERIRDQQAFPDRENLMARIKKDAEIARAHRMPPSPQGR